MKKLLSVIAAMVMVMAFSMTVFASGTGSITITNATKDQKYNIYRIFDATVKTGTGGAIEGVSYSIKTDNQFFTLLFGADGKTVNPYFNYDPATGVVTKKTGVSDSDLTNYLRDLVAGGTYTTAADEETATSATVEFDNLSYGYYLITSTLASAVTITSNTPDVEVIDKNQEPAEDFDKQVATGKDANGNPTGYADENTAYIGDVVHYKISFTATNYDKQSRIKHYSIHDSKGEGIWVEFDSIKVKVGDEELTRGYYICYDDSLKGDGDDWEFLNEEDGAWDGYEKKADNAQWYLVHLGYDQFRITIPWLEGHSLVEVKDANNNVVSHTLKYPDNAESRFESPIDVEVTYAAAVEPNATIGGLPGSNLYNTASGSWTGEHETGTTEPDTVETKVYGIGILKDDASTLENLAGAEFRIYKDQDCTQPIYVIPTDIKGVYIVDSLGREGAGVSGTKMDTARILYKDYLAEYLGTNTQDNLLVTQVNGKVVVVGLEKGTYYLKEVTPPPGYNALDNVVEIKAGEGTKAFSIFADENGNVADLQETDGIHLEKDYQVTSTTVHNSKGVELPSTGGFGRTAIITCGTLVALAFAILLITHKKMSIYTD